MYKRELLAAKMMIVSFLLLVVLVRYDEFLYAISYGRTIGWVICFFGVGSLFGAFFLLFRKPKQKTSSIVES